MHNLTRLSLRGAVVGVLLLLASALVLAVGPQPGLVAGQQAGQRGARTVPPPGIAILDADRTALQSASAELGRAVEALRRNIAAAPYLPDVEILHVVGNSGFAFREYDYLNNARQVSKLPDWAVVDVTVPPRARAPGRIVVAGFFDERWQLRPAGH